MTDRAGKTVTVGARVVFGQDRTVGVVRVVRELPGHMRPFFNATPRARCDDGAIDNPDLHTNGHTASEWVDSNHVEVIS